MAKIAHFLSFLKLKKGRSTNVNLIFDKKKMISSYNLRQNLENLREKKGQFTCVNLILLIFWQTFWILSDEWGHFVFFKCQNTDNGAAFWKDTFHVFVKKKVRSKNMVHYKREWEKYTIWSDFPGGRGHFGKIVRGHFGKPSLF